MTKSILLVGVGGQGTILASKILTLGLMDAGYDVKMSEIHGMSQRGGSVSSQIRYGENVDSPVIDKGTADVLISFEKMEALRWLEYLSPGGTVVVNNFEIPSMSVITGQEEYPDNVVGLISERADTKIIEATQLATDLGNSKVSNIILLGTIINSMNLESIDWKKIISENVNPAFVDMNLSALETGMKAV